MKFINAEAGIRNVVTLLYGAVGGGKPQPLVNDGCKKYALPGSK